VLKRNFCAAWLRVARTWQAAAAGSRRPSPLPIVLALTLAPVLHSCANAHEIAGNRFFPATLAIDDPGVNDELAMPTIAVTKSGDEPPVKELDISGEYAKRLTESLAISVAPAWTHLYAPGGSNGNGASGFQTLETTLKYRFYRDPVHELVMSVGLSIDWGGSVGRRRRQVHHLHADAVFRQRLRRPARPDMVGAPDRPDRHRRLFNSWQRPERHVGGRCERKRQRQYCAKPPVSQLGPVAAVQPAVPQVGSV
jgi:hypothetical protein